VSRNHAAIVCRRAAADPARLARLMVNVGIVLVFAAFGLRFLKRV
jgi:hypothetical protein